MSDIRDVGPFTDWLHATTQYRNETAGTPPGPGVNAALILNALMSAGVKFSEFEKDMLSVPIDGHDMDAATATVLAGFVYRSWKAGFEHGKTRGRILHPQDRISITTKDDRVVLRCAWHPHWEPSIRGDDPGTVQSKIDYHFKDVKH